MHIHILGIGGTFMAGVGLLAREAGHVVTGSDAGVYPPMSTQLAAAGIEVMTGYEPSHLAPEPDCVVIGNALSRGNAAVEAVLDAGMAYQSGPEWLADNVLVGHHVLAVAGTHGKTTTASMLAHILVEAGLDPGWLIGGVAHDLGRSATLGAGRYFVIEADEYDTAFFDKRSKFVHYHPRTCVLNNLEYDHADIFDDIEAIRRQFHHLVRTVPGNGALIVNAAEPELNAVLTRGCWTPVSYFNTPDEWSITSGHNADNELSVARAQTAQGRFRPRLAGRHNGLNALAAIAAAHAVGVTGERACAAMDRFAGVKRRLELRADIDDIRVLDDFAHHPTAIRETLAALRDRPQRHRILVVFQPASNTMRAGVHGERLAAAFDGADCLFVFDEGLDWRPQAVLDGRAFRLVVESSTDALIAAVMDESRPGDDIVVMSNAGFDNIHQRLIERLQTKAVGR